jgi:hypothetical protein
MSIFSSPRLTGLANHNNPSTILLRMSQEKLIRKTVGKRPAEQSVFERIRRLNRSLARMGVKANDNGEHIRRVVGRSRQ